MLQAGDVIGEMAVLTGSGIRNASVVAKTPVTVCVFAEETFRNFIRYSGLQDMLEKRWLLRPVGQGPARMADVREYRVILQRKDPPVDDLFIAHARHFEEAPEAIVQINRPPATFELSEHTAALRYPEYAAPTSVCTRRSARQRCRSPWASRRSRPRRASWSRFGRCSAAGRSPAVRRRSP